MELLQGRSRNLGGRWPLTSPGPSFARSAQWSMSKSVCVRVSTCLGFLRAAESLSGVLTPDGTHP